MKKKNTGPTQATLDRLCRQWQRRLRLQDWDVRIAFARPGEMQTEDASGEVAWQYQKRLADISIIHPDCWPRNRTRPQCIEYTIVHELLHLVLAPWPVPTSRENELREQAIHQIAQALTKQ